MTVRQVGPGTPSFAAAHAVTPSTAPQTAAAKPVRRSLMVLLPADGDYVASSSIAVAGLAFGRPRSPRVSAVEVELFVDGRLVDHVRLDVQSSRFAGFLKLSNPIGTTDAELRISDPNGQSGPMVVRHLTIDRPRLLRFAASEMGGDGDRRPASRSPSIGVTRPQGGEGQSSCAPPPSSCSPASSPP